MTSLAADVIPVPLVILAVLCIHCIVRRLWLFVVASRSDFEPQPYGMGPCGVARVTYPSTFGLTVTELPR